MSNEIPLLVIMGPTASGKSALALEAARQLNGEIVSVDSMQIYRELEIGTAQPTREEQTEIPHHLVGCFDFHHKIDVYQFQSLADHAIAEIQSRGKLPILAGGTGMYLRAILYGIDNLPADEQLRKQLDAEYDHKAGEAALFKKMAQLDPVAYERWRHCRRRLIRALEVKLLTGKSIIELQKISKDLLRYPVKAWKLELPNDILRKRISDRAAAMLKSGWIEEARRAIANGLLGSPTAHQAIGYKLIGEYLANRLDIAQLHEKISTATWQFARRQKTWFRHQHPEAQELAIESAPKLAELYLNS